MAARTNFSDFHHALEDRVPNRDKSQSRGSENSVSSSGSEPLMPPEPSKVGYIIATVIWVSVMVAATVLIAVYSVAKVADDACNHGTALPGDVTVPNDPNFGDVIAIIYGFIPYVGGLVCLVLWIFRRTVWPLLILIMAGIIVVLNEGCIKKLVSQARPSGSCLHTSGMPSSHSELAIGFWFYFHLEILIKGKITSTSEWTTLKKGYVLMAVYVLLLPVPFTRVALHDHSWEQVGVGALVGICVASLWYCLMNFVIFKHLDKLSEFLSMCPCCWGEGLFHGFLNDYSPTPAPADCSSHQNELRNERYPDTNREDLPLAYTTNRLTGSDSSLNWFKGEPMAVDRHFAADGTGYSANAGYSAVTVDPEDPTQYAFRNEASSGF